MDRAFSFKDKNLAAGPGKTADTTPASNGDDLAGVTPAPNRSEGFAAPPASNGGRGAAEPTSAPSWAAGGPNGGFGAAGGGVAGLASGSLVPTGLAPTHLGGEPIVTPRQENGWVLLGWAAIVGLTGVLKAPTLVEMVKRTASRNAQWIHWRRNGDSGELCEVEYMDWSNSTWCRGGVSEDALEAALDSAGEDAANEAQRAWSGADGSLRDEAGCVVKKDLLGPNDPYFYNDRWNELCFTPGGGMGSGSDAYDPYSGGYAGSEVGYGFWAGSPYPPNATCYPLYHVLHAVSAYDRPDAYSDKCVWFPVNAEVDGSGGLAYRAVLTTASQCGILLIGLVHLFVAPLFDYGGHMWRGLRLTFWAGIVFACLPALCTADQCWGWWLFCDIGAGVLLSLHATCYWAYLPLLARTNHRLAFPDTLLPASLGGADAAAGRVQAVLGRFLGRQPSGRDPAHDRERMIEERVYQMITIKRGMVGTVQVIVGLICIFVIATAFGSLWERAGISFALLFALLWGIGFGRMAFRMVEPLFSRPKGEQAGARWRWLLMAGPRRFGASVRMLRAQLRQLGVFYLAFLLSLIGIVSTGIEVGVILIDELELSGGQLVASALLATVVAPISVGIYYVVNRRTPLSSKNVLWACNFLNVLIFSIWFHAGMRSYGEWLAYSAIFTVLTAIAGFATSAMYAMCLPKAWVNSLNSCAAVAALCLTWIGKVVIEIFRAGGASQRGSVLSNLLFFIPALYLLFLFDADKAVDQRRIVEAWGDKLAKNSSFTTKKEKKRKNSVVEEGFTGVGSGTPYLRFDYHAVEDGEEGDSGWAAVELPQDMFDRHGAKH